MASTRSKIVNSLTRLAMRLLYRRAKPLSEINEAMQRLDAKRALKLAEGISIEEITIGATTPISGRWLLNGHTDSNLPPKTDLKNRVILYLHGGAFVMRMPVVHSNMVSQFCHALDASAFIPWYRLAPEHRFPAAPEDCVTAYKYLLESGYSPSDIIVMGDSAGANLCLALMHLLRDQGIALPQAVVALSPITDFAQISASWRQRTWADPMYRVQAFVNPVEHYLRDLDDLTSPYASPYYGDLTGFPPTLLIVGGIEALMDDSVGYVRKAIEQNVNAKVQIWEGMAHVFTLMDFLPETALAIAEIRKWLTQLDQPASTQPIPAIFGCVETINIAPLTHKISRNDNKKYLIAQRSQNNIKSNNPTSIEVRTNVI